MLYQLFAYMENKGILDVTNNVGIFAALHYVYLPHSQRNLDQFASAIMHRPLWTA